MSFYARICWQEEPHIPWHTFQAAMKELRRGRLTATQVGNTFNLSAAERSEIQTVIARINGGQLTVEELDDIGLLADARFPGYDAASALMTRLGV